MVDKLLQSALQSYTLLFLTGLLGLTDNVTN